MTLNDDFETNHARRPTHAITIPVSAVFSSVFGFHWFFSRRYILISVDKNHSTNARIHDRNKEKTIRDSAAKYLCSNRKQFLCEMNAHNKFSVFVCVFSFQFARLFVRSILSCNAPVLARCIHNLTLHDRFTFLTLCN